MKTLREISCYYTIPLVKNHGIITDIYSFIEFVKTSSDIEGFVIRFNNGHMLKIKTEEYTLQHKALSQLVNEKDIWAIIIDDKLDDLLPLIAIEERERFIKFKKDLYIELDKTAERLNWIVIAAKDNLNNSKKRFALEGIPQHDSTVRGLLFKIWDGEDARKVVYEYVRKNTSTSTTLDSVRGLAGGIIWGAY